VRRYFPWLSWLSWPKSRPEPASSYDGVRSGDYWALQAPWARAGSTPHQEGRSKPAAPGWPALLRPAVPPRRRGGAPRLPWRRPALPPSGATAWSSPCPARRLARPAPRVASPALGPDKTHTRQPAPELRGLRTGANRRHHPAPPPRGMICARAQVTQRAAAPRAHPPLMS
jgi:hypothetical protein